MTNLKRIFIVMLVIILLGATAVFATNDVTNTIVITGDEQTPTPAPNENTNTNTNTNTNIPTNTNTSTYTNSNLPQTGENDHIVILSIAIFAISAVYAYKKIRDYKNI